MNALETLKQRGFVEQITHEAEITELLSKEKAVFYIGYDPTADSLHIGHYLTFMAMSWMQRAGHIPIVLLGGGTGMVGDPDKADSMRPMMDITQIDHNIERFKAQAAKFIDFSPGKAILANNADWLRHLNYANFIRDYGIHFSVNRMLAADKYKTKFEGSGLNFFELNYMVMQAYDFLELSRRYGCVMQAGGNDQWSNIIAGVELIRRVDGKQAYGMTFALLPRSDGQKMGKSMGGTVWLDAAKTSPYEFYQYFRNVHDGVVRQYLAQLTFLPMDEVEQLAAAEGTEINRSKEVLAYEITKIVHGEEEAAKAQEAARTLFSGAGTAGAPTTPITATDLGEGMAIIDLMLLAGLDKSKSDARRTIQQGGLIINGEKTTDIGRIVTQADFVDGEVVLQKGKKTFHKIALQ
ncbi:MAG: tyrosine--tRNA ligase [Defluviitaleaceae bacterium]|nr:tyrosine--tRNA ligase [Defluviitaleaceae bacterium]